MPTNDQSLKSLWQTLPSEKVVFTHEHMQQRAEKFHAKHKRRSILEYLSFAVLLAWIACDPTFRSDWKAIVASGLAIIGCMILLWNYNRIAKVKAAPSANPNETMPTYLRRELTRQRDAAATAWKWYVLPATPFFIFVFLFRWMEEGTTLTEFTNTRIMILSVFAFLVTFLVAIVFWQFLNAARYQRQLDTLDRNTGM